MTAESKHAKGGLRPVGRKSESDGLLFNWLLLDMKHDKVSKEENVCAPSL